MKLHLGETGYVSGYTVSCLDYENAPGVEYSGEVPENFASSCQNYRYENGALILDEEKAARRDQAVQMQQELLKIEAWFPWYDNQCSQYMRSVRLGEPFDQDMDVLDQEAKAKQLRIREIKASLEG